MFSPGMSAAVTTTTFDQSTSGSSSSATKRRVGVGRADRGAVPGAREDEVVGVLRRAGELRRALAPERRGAAGAARGDVPGVDDERLGARSRRARRGWSGWAGSGSSSARSGPSCVRSDTTGSGREPDGGERARYRTSGVCG